MRCRRGDGDCGQTSVEWIGLLALVALSLGALLAAAGSRLPGGGPARQVAAAIVCAVRLTSPCGQAEDELLDAYGAELAGQIRAHAPELVYERGMRALPVDFRRCRRPACADGPESGEVWRSWAGVPAAAFVHAIDCRRPDDAAPEGYDCSGGRRGNLYLQYWLYYPESATMRALLGERGHHRDDWESYAVRIGRGGRVDARSSSHNGFDYGGGALNWASDAGWRGLDGALVAAGLRRRAAWGPVQGRAYISGGSHAGHAAELEPRDLAATLAATVARHRSGRPLPPRLQAHQWIAIRRRWARRLFGQSTAGRTTPAHRLRLIPLEPIARRRGERPRFAVTPPWRKHVWRDPEYARTD